MSIEAMNWAMNWAPIPSGGKASKAVCAGVLTGLANHAGPDGRHAFPSIERLMRYTCLSRRAVQNGIADLLAAGVIVPSARPVVAAYIDRPDQRPNSYDLRLDLRDAERGAGDAPRGDNGVQEMRERGAGDAERGARHTERGAGGAPEPSLTTHEPSTEPSLTPEGVQSVLVEVAPGVEMLGKVVKPLTAEETRRAEAKRLVEWWWDNQSPKPAGRNAFWGSVGAVEAVLKAGHSIDAVRLVLPDVTPPMSARALEYHLNRTKRPNGHTPVSDFSDGQGWYAEDRKDAHHG